MIYVSDTAILPGHKILCVLRKSFINWCDSLLNFENLSEHALIFRWMWFLLMYMIRNFHEKTRIFPLAHSGRDNPLPGLRYAGFSGKSTVQRVHRSYRSKIHSSVYVSFFKPHIHLTAHTPFFGPRLHIHLLSKFLETLLESCFS